METKTDPLKALDNGEVGKYILRGTILVTFAVAFLDGYDLVNIGLYLPTITKLFAASAFEEGLVSSILIGGAVVGAVFFGYLSSKIGPRTMIIVDFALYGIGAVFSAFSVNIDMLLLMRFIIGLGFGGDFAIAPALIADMVPKDRRGRYQAMMFYGYPAGAFVAILTSFIISLAGIPVTLAWRIVLGLGVVPNIVVILLRTRLSQSPRWLLYTGRMNEFKQSVSKISGIKEENLEDVKINKKTGIGDIFRNYGRQFTAVMMGFLSLALGFPVLYVSVAIKHVGITSFASIIGFNLLTWTIALIGVTYVYFSVDSPRKRMGRKFNLAIGIAVEATTNFAIAMLLAPQYAVVVVVLIGISLFGVYVVESQALTMQGEIFPSDIKTTAGGITFGLNRLIFFIDSTLVAIAFSVNFFSGFLIIEAVIQFSALAVFLLLAGETKSKSLETITRVSEEIEKTD